MYWCRSSTTDSDAVEVKVKTTFDAAESWVDSCKARRAQNDLQRKQNQQARMRLVEKRSRLLEEQSLTKEKLEKIHAKIATLDDLMKQIVLAESELNAVEEQIKRDEQCILERESVLREHLNSIAKLTSDAPVASQSGSSTSVASPNKRTGQSSDDSRTPKTAPSRLNLDAVIEAETPVGLPYRSITSSV